MGLQDVIRFLLPREEHFFDILEQQAAVAHEGALALARLTEGSPAATVRDAVQEIEHRGDKIAYSMEEALAKTFVTPLDREDLQKLSSELDDVLDFMNGAARACVLFGVQTPTAPMVELIKVLIRGAEIISAAVPHLRKHDFTGLLETTRKMRDLEKEGDAIFRTAISALFHDPAVDAKVLLREREVLEDLEAAIDTCDQVADTLAHLAVKHG